jgi:hypothetical protein
LHGAGKTTGRAFAAAVEEKPAGMFMIRQRIRVVKRHPEGGIGERGPKG